MSYHEARLGGPRDLSRTLAPLLLVASLSACARVDPPSDAGVTCDREGFSPRWERATTESFGVQYTGLTSEDLPHDALLVQVYEDAGGPGGPGTYDLEGSNFSDCGLCLLAFADCEQTRCGKTFFASSGTVEITAFGQLGERFTASLQGVTFEEVIIASGTYQSIPVPGGERWCLDGYAFDEEVVDPVVATCAEDDVTCVGERAPDFDLLNCGSGDLEGMAEVARGGQALWLALTAGWCEACQEQLPGKLHRGDELADRGLVMAIVLGEDDQGGQPSLEYCREYADRFGANPARFYIDHDGSSSFAATFTAIFPYLDESSAVSLPWSGVLDAETFEYIHGDGAGTSLDEALEALLD